MGKGNSNKYKLGYRTTKSFIGKNPYRLVNKKTDLFDRDKLAGNFNKLKNGSGKNKSGD